MKCPHCAKSISHFSPVILGVGRLDAKKLCPHCAGPFSITGNLALALAVGVITLIAGFFLIRPIPWVGAALWGFTSVALPFMVAARLKKFEE